MEDGQRRIQMIKAGVLKFEHVDRRVDEARDLVGGLLLGAKASAKKARPARRQKDEIAPLEDGSATETDVKPASLERQMAIPLFHAALDMSRPREKCVIRVVPADQKGVVLHEDRIVGPVNEGQPFDLCTERLQKLRKRAMLPRRAPRLRGPDAHVGVDLPGYFEGACVRTRFPAASGAAPGRAHDEPGVVPRKGNRHGGHGSNMRAGVILASVRTMNQAVIHPNGSPAVRASPPDIARRLASFNRRRFTPELDVGLESTSFAGDSEESDLHRQELDFVHDELRAVEGQASAAPTDPDAFVQWFERLEAVGPGQHDPLFEWLETSASKEAMTWFLAQEVAGEAGFEDLVALTQIKMPTRAKLELARNYWDEMGQGQASAMHGPMLSRLADELGIASRLEEAVWESLAMSNLMIGMAVHRRHAYRSIGALGVIELTAPGRARKVNEGLKRLGFGGEARRYYALHSTLDLKHSEAWNREILRPLVASDPRMARPIAEGALARLTAGARCFDRYRRTLNFGRGETPNRPTS